MFEQINQFLAPALMLFVTGFIGAMFKKNTIVIFMSIELMLCGAMLAMLSFAAANNDINGAVFPLFIMAIAAAEVAVGLAVIVRMFKVSNTVNVDSMNSLGD